MWIKDCLSSYPVIKPITITQITKIMTAKDLFEKLAPLYKKTYQEANGYPLKNLEYKDGWVVINNTTKCRAKELQKFTETLLKRIEKQKNKNPDYPSYNIKTKIKFVNNEQP